MFTGTALLAVTEYTMPDALADFFVKLPHNLKFMQVDHAYVWERHATIKAFWRLLLQGRGAGNMMPVVSVLVAACQFGLATYCIVCVRKFISYRRSIRPDAIIAATIVTMPLLMPFYFDYDLMLIAVAAVLYARERSHQEFAKLDQWIVRIWAILFVWMLVNPGITAQTRFNLNVPLLFTLAILLIRRAGRVADEYAQTQEDEIPLGHRYAKVAWA